MYFIVRELLCELNICTIWEHIFAGSNISEDLGICAVKADSEVP